MTVSTQPTGQNCIVTNGSGTLSGASVTDVSVGCAISGSLDPSFDTDGIFGYDSAGAGTPNDGGRAIAVQSDGKILVAGYRWNGSDLDMAVWRLNTDGTPDTTFDSDGVFVHHDAAGGGENDEAFGITLQPDGKILVTGQSFGVTGNPIKYIDMVVWRLNTDGSLDTTFDTDGFVLGGDPAGGQDGHEYGYGITVQSDGKILVAGRSWGTTADMVVWRLNTDGSPDTTFDSNGTFVHDNAAGGAGDDYGYGITVQSDGKILVAGYSHNGTNNDMAVWRLNTNGSPDTTFDSDGIFVHDNAAGGSGDDQGRAITLQSDGKILVTGHSVNAGANNDIVAWRLNTDGSPDTTFDTDGIFVNAGGSGDDQGYGITQQSDGKILVAGYSHNGGNFDTVALRLNTDGSPDTNFDSDGIFVHNNAAGGNGDDQGHAITLQSDGKILVTGYSVNAGADKDMTVWRIWP